ncbi:hypothetical protein ACWDR4_38720, partial [Streptomyces sp. NPDC000878]
MGGVSGAAPSWLVAQFPAPLKDEKHGAQPLLFRGAGSWVATRDLQLLRYPEKSAIAQPVAAGCYLSTY